MSQQPQQQITLNPIQLLQITAATLEQLQKWIENKMGKYEEDSHPKKTLEARNSIFHTRLILGVRHREILVEIAKQQEKARHEAALRAPQGYLAEIAKEMKPLPLAYIDTDDTKRMFHKVTTQQGC